MQNVSKNLQGRWATWGTYVGHSDRLDNRRQQIDHDDETHRETAETAKLVQEDEFTQVVDRRVDPTPTLGQENFPIIGSNGVRMGVPDELRLIIREVLQE